MARRVTATVLVALAAITMPAFAEEAPMPSGRSDVDPSITSGSAQHELSAARRRWHRDGPRSYTYRLQLACYCTSDAVQPHKFVVRDGQPVDPPKGWRYAATMPRLFALVRSAIDKRVDVLVVRYRRNGSLEELSVDESRKFVDDEYSYSVDRFRRLR